MSDHFDGSRYHNLPQGEQPGAGDMLRWMLHRESGPWGPPRDGPPGPPPPRQVDGGRLRVTWVGHSTVLVQMDGLNVLTDPVWSERASPVSFAGPRRMRPPALRFEDLPPVHAVLVSHDHYDHLDLPTLRRLESAHHPRFVVGQGNGALLRDEGLRTVVELDWWQGAELPGGARATMVPSRHFSGRGPFGRDRTLWGGFVLAGPSGRVFFAGDTAYGRHFAEIARREGPLRLALLPIGAFRPRWFMGAVHMAPDEAVRAHRDMGAACSMAVHFGTFRLADDGETEPVDLLREALAAEGTGPQPFRVPEFGVGWDVPAGAETALAPAGKAP